MRNRIAEMRAADSGKKVEAYQNIPIDFAKLKVSGGTIDDAIYTIAGDLKKANPMLANKQHVIESINNLDYAELRKISDFFYRASGIYNRIIRYMAFMYRYDWMLVPYILDESVSKEKILTTFNNELKILDNFYIKRQLGEIALKVLRNGCYYGYKVEQNGTVALQELPPNYCRAKLKQGRKIAVEMNMKFFDDQFTNTTQRMKVLKIFPKEIQEGYHLYKSKKLQGDTPGEQAGWFLLDPDKTVKFNANGEDYPAFISVIPHLIDLDEAQDLERKKLKQQLSKIIIQKMPLDKNNEMVFDIDEIQQLHRNAVGMIGNTVGFHVLTTVADVEVADTSDTAASSQADNLERLERQVFNEAGVSQGQFNTDGNIALEKSGLNDEATMYNLLLQFEEFLNDLIEGRNKKNKIEFRVQLLTTTIYNYKDLAKLYKDQMTVGLSKIMPQIALGQSQSAILANAYFENEVLDLITVLLPPMQSSTMNAQGVKDLSKKAGTDNGSSTDSNGGRPEKPDSEKSDKTLQNREAMG